MARTRSMTHCSILSDPDWLALSRDARFLYSVLLLQTKLTLAGSLDYVPQRWAPTCSATPAEVESWVDELEQARFVQVDRETFELVIRTFTKHDLGDRPNVNIVKGMWSAWAAILSPRLRQVVVEAMPADIFNRVEAPKEAIDIRAGQTPFERPLERASERSFEPPIERSPEPPVAFSLLPEACDLPPVQAPLSLVPVTITAPSVPRADADFDRFWDAYPLKKGKKPARVSWDRAIKAGWNPEVIIDGAAAYRAEIVGSGREIKYPQGWLTDERWTDTPGPVVPRTKVERNRVALIKGLVEAAEGAPTLAERLAAAGAQPAIEAEAR
jgi:hypothetical protein